MTYKGLGRRGRLLPPLKLLVHNLEVRQCVNAGREVVERLASRGVFVRDGNLTEMVRRWKTTGGTERTLMVSKVSRISNLVTLRSV